MYAVFVGFSFKVFVMGLESHVTNWDKHHDARAYTHQPHKWLTLGVNTFVYFLTLLHMLLRLPYNVLHSVYPPFNFTIAEAFSALNLGAIVKFAVKYYNQFIDFLRTFPDSRYFR